LKLLNSKIFQAYYKKSRLKKKAVGKRQEALVIWQKFFFFQKERKTVLKIKFKIAKLNI